MRKKGSVLTALAYLIAIIFIALVTYKVFTFAVDKTPDIQVREISDKYDYALNAPEDVEIYHSFPGSSFEGCGVGAVMFEVDLDSNKEVIDGDYLGIARCGNGCIDYFNSMSTIMNVMLGIDTAQGVYEVLSFWHGGHLISAAADKAIRDGAVGKISRNAVREAAEDMIEKDSSSAFVKYMKRRMVKSASRSSLGRKISTSAIEKSLISSGVEESTQQWSRIIWKATVDDMLGTSLGNNFAKHVKNGWASFLDPVRQIDKVVLKDLGKDEWFDTMVYIFKNNPEAGIDLVSKEAELVALRHLDNLGTAKLDKVITSAMTSTRYNLDAGITNVPEMARVLREMPNNPGMVLDYTDLMVDKIKKSSTVRLTEGLADAIDSSVTANDLSILADYVTNQKLAQNLLPNYKELYVKTMKEYASSTLQGAGVNIRQAVVNTGDDLFKKKFAARVIGRETAEVMFRGTGLEFVKEVNRLTLRPLTKLRIYRRFRTAVSKTILASGKVARGAGRVTATGTGVGAVSRGIISDIGSSTPGPAGDVAGWVGSVFGVPGPNTFLGICCFETDYRKRLGLETAQFASSFASVVPGASFIQSALDVLTLEIYSEEVELCKEDIALYDHIRDNNLKPSLKSSIEKKKEAKKWISYSDPFDTEILARNYVSNPESLSLSKNTSSGELEVRAW